MKSHMLPRNILRFFREQNVSCAIRYNMTLLEAVGMIPTGKNFTVATAFMCNEHATTYRWVLQQIKHIYVSSAMPSENDSILNDCKPIVIITDRESELMPVWTSEVLHFSVETMNRVESEHSVLKLWLSTCHGDLDTVFLNIDSLIEGQIAEIKTSLEISKLKEKYIHALPLQAEDIYIVWRKLEIGVDIPNIHERDMDSEMRDLTSMLEEISTSPISKVREVRRLIKGVISSVLPDDPCAPLTTPPPPPQNLSHEGMAEDEFNQKG
ncbi:hypothetical protein M9H77_08215 [Catharanthus roseus]|uniref:Uncharacterized protein n=1 Tax=Catharanthus roseus TaxID=4058 RepID=A0ACC0BXB0_CATRO|nr:hypothetical protein M9H77_08215 [Catharanthus roseus]